MNNIKTVITKDNKTLEFRPTQDCYNRTPLLAEFMEGITLDLEKLENLEHPGFRNNN